MKVIASSMIIILLLLFFCSCATTSKGIHEGVSSLAITDISEGLPRDGQWRQNIALIDMNGDGFLDIVAPPPRKAEGEKNRPYIFLYDEKNKNWREGSFTFPELKGYGYGGIAVGDLNRDGYTDIVLAVHTGRIILLLNDKGNGFIERAFPLKDFFNSRMVEVADVNGDGWPDIIAFSEGFFTGAYKPKGILVGINKDGKDWDVKTIEESIGVFGDSMAIGDVRGDGNKDIIIAPLTAVKEQKKLIWLGDGKGNFKEYDADLAGDTIPFIVRAGDIDGDRSDEVVFKLSGLGPHGKTMLSAFKWTGEGFVDISHGLEKEENPIVYDLADVDGDGKKELIVLSERGIVIYKYLDKEWVEQVYYPISPDDTKDAFDLRAGRNRDGSVLIVYNLGGEDPTFKHGIRAYRLK